MFRYRLHSLDGSDLGESTYAVPIEPGEEILDGNGTRFHVLDVALEKENEPFVVLSPLVGLLRVKAAGAVIPTNGDSSSTSTLSIPTTGSSSSTRP